MKNSVSRIEILDIAETSGIDQAYGLLLLLGPDFYLGGYDEYNDMLETLEEAAKARGINL